MKIAIDGTAASGKGTLSKLLSKALKLPCLDTGLLYRKVAFSYIKSVKLLPRQNTIENYLLKVGVEQGKVLVLIKDEVQNLPGEMLDVFRTLLNFETDDFKLLQLIIFGQPEMGKIIKKYPNFEDRIIQLNSK